MNKASKTVLIILLVIILVIAIIGFGIIAFVSWFFGGVRFTPQDAIEAASLTASEREYIKTDDLYFYYDTAENMDEWICDVMIAEQNGIGLWHAVTNPPNDAPVYVEDTGEWAGTLMFMERNGTYHYFYIPPISGYDETTIPNFVKEGYSVITIDGNDIELFKHSYFATGAIVEEFEINGTKLVLEK